MFTRIFSAVFGCFLFAVVFTEIQNIGLCAEKEPASQPKFEVVEKAVWTYFQDQPNFQKSSIITRQQVESLFVELKRIGFEPTDPKAILEKLPDKNEFIVKELNTAAGRKFFAKIAEYPQAYDRVDRLSRLARGKQTIRDLVKGPGGEKMIEYMTTSSGGIELGKMLSQAQTVPISTSPPAASIPWKCS